MATVFMVQFFLTFACQVKKQSKLTTFSLYLFSQEIFTTERKAISRLKGYDTGFQEKKLLTETTHNIFEYINLISINQHKVTKNFGQKATSFSNV